MMEYKFIEYVFLDAHGKLRSKSRVVKFDREWENLKWSYDGSSTGQASVENSEILLNPVKLVHSPFQSDYLMLCDTPKSHRVDWPQELAEKERLMFGFEQEFFIEEWKPQSQREAQDAQSFDTNSYCQVGTSQSGKARQLLHQIVKNCLTSGIPVTGSNMEVVQGQLEIQVCDYGLDACDYLVLTRFIIARTAEQHGLTVNFEPRPPYDNCGGSGCHINFSTFKMRECQNNPYGTDVFETVIKGYLDRLRETHSVAMGLWELNNIEYYGDVQSRLTGRNETSSVHQFSSSACSRASSIRIPRDPAETGTFLLEDRRPSSDINPYLATLVIIDAVVPKSGRILKLD